MIDVKKVCPICQGEGWVCEQHPTEPFPHIYSFHECAGPRMPCKCNVDGAALSLELQDYAEEGFAIPLSEVAQKINALCARVREEERKRCADICESRINGMFPSADARAKGIMAEILNPAPEGKKEI